MKVDIKPYWNKLAAWYWEEFDQPEGDHLSIWDMLSRDYQAIKAFNTGSNTMWVIFPDKESYMMFVLRWS